MHNSSTLKTIADRLGISQSTVSRALKKPDMVSLRTHQRVVSVAKELGYIEDDFESALTDIAPNLTGSKLVGVIVPDLKNAFFMQVLDSIQETAYSHDFTPIIASSNELASVENRVLKQWSPITLRGILAMPTRNLNKALELFNQKIPIVLADRDIEDSDFDCVTVNSRIGVELILNHLRTLGHSKISFITGSRSVYTFKKRAEAAQNCYESIQLREINAFNFEELYMGAFETTNNIISGPRDKWPTAIIAANSSLAAGILYALNLRNVSVPHEISVVSYGDSMWSRFYQTPVTALRQPTEQLGTTAMQLLIDRINNTYTGPARKIELEPMLMVRQSTTSI